MADRIDWQGYLLDMNGNRLPEDQQKNQKEFQQRINEAWAASHPGDNDGPPPNTVIMLVEKGDWQWKVALQAGADPAQTVLFNGHEKNPDLIHPGDILFVGEISKYKQYADGTDNRNMFDTQFAERTKNPDDDLKSDTTRYFNSLPDGHKSALLTSILPAGSTPEEQRATQEIFEGYLASFDTKEAQQKELDRLEPLYPGNGNESASSPANRRREALEAAAKSLGLTY